MRDIRTDPAPRSGMVIVMLAAACSGGLMGGLLGLALGWALWK